MGLADPSRRLAALAVLAVVLQACASTPSLRVRPGDRCRVFWHQAGGRVPMELVNRALQEADPTVDRRLQAGPTKAMADSEMALLVQELSARRFFAHAVPGGLPPGTPAGITVEINGLAHTFPSRVAGGAEGSGALRDFAACLTALQDAFNATLSLQSVEGRH